MTRLEIESEFAAPEADVLTTLPSELSLRNVRFDLTTFSFLVPAKPGAPWNYTSSTASGVDLRWRSVTGSVQESYTVSWNPASPDGTNNKTGITATRTTINGLRSNTAYRFSVAAVNIAGYSEESVGTRIVTGLSVW